MGSLSIEDRHQLEQIVSSSVTPAQVAWGLIEAELTVGPMDLLVALKRTYEHPFDSYTERWSLRHAQELLHLAETLKTNYAEAYKK